MRTKQPRDFLYLAWITTQQCCVCESQFKLQLGRTYAHHAGSRGISQRAPDRTAIPLCWRHHDRGSSQSVHALGKLFWVAYGLEREATIRLYNERYDNEQPGAMAA